MTSLLTFLLTSTLIATALLCYGAGKLSRGDAASIYGAFRDAKQD